jgi:hypothetical protein
MQTTNTHELGWHRDNMSDFEFKLVVRGAPFSFKRAKQVVTVNGRASIGLTTKAKHYMRDAVAQLRAQWAPVFRGPIPRDIELNAAIRSYLPTRRMTDASNLYQGVEDALQACGPKCKPGCNVHASVIVDDVQIRTHNGSDRFYDKDNPRVEIVLTPYRGYTCCV